MPDKHSPEQLYCLYLRTYTKAKCGILTSDHIDCWDKEDAQRAIALATFHAHSNMPFITFVQFQE